MFYVIMTLLVDSNDDYVQSRSAEGFSFYVWGLSLKPLLVEHGIKFRESKTSLYFMIGLDNI